MMLSIASQKSPVTVVLEVIEHDLKGARAHKEEKPVIANCFYERGEVLSWLNRLDEAKGQYEKAYEWGPSSAQESLGYWLNFLRVRVALIAH
jgi:tetratricopeptide (TPR) repeat protein